MYKRSAAYIGNRQEFQVNCFLANILNKLRCSDYAVEQEQELQKI